MTTFQFSVHIRDASVFGHARSDLTLTGEAMVAAIRYRGPINVSGGQGSGGEERTLK